MSYVLRSLGGLFCFRFLGIEQGKLLRRVKLSEVKLCIKAYDIENMIRCAALWEPGQKIPGSRSCVFLFSSTCLTNL